MMRVPHIPVPTVQIQSNNTITEVRTYSVITPLFGGGVEPGKADPITIVRASEVRGQLRFWWRATRGGQFNGDLQAMRDAEEALWGGPARFDDKGQPVAGQSRVWVVIDQVESGKPISKYRGSIHIGDPRSVLSYGAFPLRETREQRAGGRSQQLSLLVGVEFTLTISYPRTEQNDVYAALWAWETFGGIGARTRRGFGAIKLIKLTKNGKSGHINQPTTNSSNDVTNWLRQNLGQYILPGEWHEAIPHLNQQHRIKVARGVQNYQIRRDLLKDLVTCMLRENNLKDPEIRTLTEALVAWYYPIHKMQLFRQKRRNNYRRSYWPEPDEIRARTRGFRGRHSQRLTTVPKFPRAVFGLPIVFKFKDEDIDPPQTILQGQEHERLSSRLILRPIACSNGSYACVATVLDGPTLPPGGLKLEGATQAGNINTTRLTPSEAKFPPLQGQTDVLQAFLDTL